MAEGAYLDSGKALLNWRDPNHKAAFPSSRRRALPSPVPSDPPPGVAQISKKRRVYLGESQGLSPDPAQVGALADDPGPPSSPQPGLAGERRAAPTDCTDASQISKGMPSII